MKYHSEIPVFPRWIGCALHLDKMAVKSGGRRLRQWLIEQINSSCYPGLLWEDEARTMFRIPWKHAGKQDYNQDVDASIFKAWAMFKGKFKEGDKAEPATWKTRLRCALNKSPDFEEVTERSQLDISEPYKVYRIIPDEEQKCRNAATLSGSTCTEVTDMEHSSSELDRLMKEPAHADHVGNLKQSQSATQDPSEDCWSQGFYLSPMMITFFYGGKMVGSMLSSHPEGCRISASVTKKFSLSPDGLHNITFPPIQTIECERRRHLTWKLFAHLERGVVLHAGQDGIFIKRLCQSRVFWSGMCSQHSPGPCKLERDAVVKIFDTNRFLQALQLFQEGQYPAPDPTVTLCFGEEFHDVSTAKSKLVIVQITPMNCQQLLDAVNSRRSLQGTGNPEVAAELQNEQIAHIFQDLCSYTAPQPSFWENQPITV